MDDQLIARQIANEFANAGISAQEAAFAATDYWLQKQRPCMMLKPYLVRANDGLWKCGFHEVVVYGESPAEAYKKFDEAWIKDRKE